MLQSRPGYGPASSRADEVPSRDFGPATVWRRAEGVLWRLVLDDLVALRQDGESEPFALSGGRRLWEALDEEKRLDHLAEALGAMDSKQELLEVLDSLVDSGVVERSEG